MPRETDHLSGWRMWLQGMVIVSKNVTYRIKPFRLFQGVDFLSKAVMFDFANKWKPIFGMMEQYDGFSVPNVVDDEFVHSSFGLAMEYLKTRAWYVWRKAKDHRAVNDYSIGTWSRYVQRSSIEKWGTLEDKASLPAPTARNKAHKSKRTFVIHGDARVDGRIRVNKVPRRTVIRRAVGEQVAATFEDAFGGVV